MTSYAMYVGNGNYVDGVPMRDLNREEWELLTPEQRETALKAGTHKLNTKAAKAAEVKDDTTDTAHS